MTEQIQVPDDLKHLYEMAYTDNEPYAPSTVTALIRRIATAEAERDIQYEFNIAQIAKRAELEAQIARLSEPSSDEELERHFDVISGNFVVDTVSMDAFISARKEEPVF